MKSFWYCMLGISLVCSLAVNAASEDAEQSNVSEEDKLFMEFEAAELEYLSLKAYNDQLEKLIASQQQEITTANNQLAGVDATELGIRPLMAEMVDGLEQFIELDMPFLLNERRERVANLRVLLEDSTVDDPERYRRIIEAFQIENDYGRDVISDVGKLPGASGEDITVNLLRIGRIALVYQTLDGKQSGFWNQRQRKWEPLSEEYNKAIKQGIRIALKQASPGLISLPVPSPEVNQ